MKGDGAMNEQEQWRELGQQLRVDSVRAAAAAGSGHPTSSMSAADLMAVLLAKYLRYDFDRAAEPLNDHLIFSKGHASPLLYSLYKAAGAISDDELLSFRRLGSRLEGHPTPQIPWVDVATGSLGQGLPCAVGVALAGKRLDRVPYRVWVLCGDSEMAEGSIWEAFDHASHESLDNLIAIVDVNRLGQRGETMHGWDTAAYVRRAQAFGWRALEIDGHDFDEIDGAYQQALAGDGQPVAIIARTV
jgi:transketolase